MTSLPGISLLVAGPARGRPLVLLHGVGSNARSFSGVFAELAGQHRLVAWDCPGYGGSAPLGLEHPTATDYVHALERLLEWLGIDTFDLLGHSMGALIAGRAAQLLAPRIRRLVLSSPALGNGAPVGVPLAPSAQTRIDALIAEGHETFAATRGPRLVHRRDDKALVAEVVGTMAQVRMPGYAQACHLLSCSDLVADAARIRIRTLVMVGAQDEITPPQSCRRVYDALMKASPELGHRFELIDQAGHAVAQEQPRAVARLLRDFLES